MLSRVAERMYWIGRQLERAENTARLVGVNANLSLDLPPSAVRSVWQTLISISGTDELFSSHYQNKDERNIAKFLLADGFNPGSILSALAMARENARTTREIMPSEGWEQINNLYLYVRNNAANALSRSSRNEFLQQITLACQQISGLLAGTLSHDSPYQFVRLGNNLERADMTTRIVDVGCSELLPFDRESGAPHPYENILWMNVLRSLSAYQMYRQHVHDRVNGEDVVTFLLQDSRFPRAVAHCLGRIDACLQQLPRNEAPLRSNARVQRRVAEADMAALLESGLHAFIDELQLELAATHEQIAATWFSPPASS